MKQEDEARLIESYVSSSRYVLDKDGVLGRAEESSWASDAMYEISRSEPTLALKLCMKIAEADGSGEMLERVANGPLLEILRRADRACLTEIGRIASGETALRDLLSYVWEENELPESAWAIIHEHSTE